MARTNTNTWSRKQAQEQDYHTCRINCILFNFYYFVFIKSYTQTQQIHGITVNNTSLVEFNLEITHL